LKLYLLLQEIVASRLRRSAHEVLEEIQMFTLDQVGTGRRSCRYEADEKNAYKKLTRRDETIWET
jgi:hypothetical protein